MKTLKIIVAASLLIMTAACNAPQEVSQDASNGQSESPGPGQSAVEDAVSNPNVVQIAAGSKDHTTLVAAVKAASLVDALSNAGPFTVFAPVNAAFDKLPAGTVESLLTPEKRDALTDILEYHVYVGVIRTEQMNDGMTLNQVNGKNIRVNITEGQPVINGKARLLASIPASNGIIHVIDEVLLPE